MAKDFNGLEITNVEFFARETGSLKAFAKVTFNNVLVIDGFKIFQSAGRTWASAPSEKKEEKWVDRIGFVDKAWYGKDANPLLMAVADAYTGAGKTKSTGKVSAKKPVVEDSEPW